MLTHRHGPIGFVLSAVALGAGCAGSSRAPALPATPIQCAHGYAVTATNNTAREVDIWQLASGQWAYVASVSARATRELPLTGGGRVEWRWPPTAPRYDPALSVDVTLHLHCT